MRRSMDAPARAVPHPYGGGAAIDGRQPVRVCSPLAAKIAGIFARNCTFGKVPLSRRRHTGPPLRRRVRALGLYLRLK